MVQQVEEPGDDTQFISTVYGQRFLLMKRQIWAGLRDVHVGASRREPGGGRARRTATAKQEFMEAFGHTADRHSPIDPAGGLAAAVEAMPRFFRAMGGMHRIVESGERCLDHLSHCGWWWCQQAESLTEKHWLGLSRAYATLKRQGVDPWGVEVGLLAVEWHEAEYRAFERNEVVKKVLPSIEKMLAEVDGISNVATMIRMLQKQVDQHAAKVEGAAPVGQAGGAPKNVGRRAALKAADKFFQPSAVAAISVLACGELDGLDDFDRYSTAINEAARRMRAEPG